MKSRLNKLSEKIGFTETEIKVIIFLLVVFSVGFGYKYFFIDSKKPVYKEFDYSKQDSMFYAAIKRDSLLKLKSKKEVDYKQEVSDFSKTKVIKQNSLNLNTADLSKLSLLPGIGEKTAKNIIDYRRRKNGFKNLNELLKIKGIGKIKFTKIKKYLYIDK